MAAASSACPAAVPKIAPAGPSRPMPHSTPTAATAEAEALAMARALNAFRICRPVLTTTWTKPNATLSPHSGSIQRASAYLPSNARPVIVGQAAHTNPAQARAKAAPAMPDIVSSRT